MEDVEKSRSAKIRSIPRVIQVTRANLFVILQFVWLGNRIHVHIYQPDILYHQSDVLGYCSSTNSGNDERSMMSGRFEDGHPSYSN